MVKAYNQLDAKLVQAELTWYEAEYRRELNREPRSNANEASEKYLKRLDRSLEDHYIDRGVDRYEHHQKMFESVNRDIAAYLDKSGNEATKTLYLAEPSEDPRVRVRAVADKLKIRFHSEAKTLFSSEPELARQLKEIEKSIDAESKRLKRSREKTIGDFKSAQAAIKENRNEAIRAIRDKEKHGGEVYDRIMDDAESADVELERKYNAAIEELNEKSKNVGFDVRKKIASTNSRSALLSQVFEYGSPYSEENFKFANQRVAGILKAGLKIRAVQTTIPKFPSLISRDAAYGPADCVDDFRALAKPR